jgi:SAM-dependent methyltransferase
MQKRHLSKKQYFEEQAETTKKFVIPYISELVNIDSKTTVLEIGCAEAGNLKPFLDLGCKVTGVDISCGRIELAKQFYQNHQSREKLELICEDIYKVKTLDKKFDVIIMRDVIEHIPDQLKFMGFVKQFLNPEGIFFLAFPPWQNPFGGHQQICQNTILSKMPYFHLLPNFFYKLILKLSGEDEARIKELLFIKETGISIERFERILKLENYSVNKRTFYFINPNYETKFGLKPRKQNKIIASIPWLRDFFTTAMYYAISKNQ